MAGDLLEEYQLGRSPLWYWRQVWVAIWVARLRFIRVAFSRSVVRTLLRIAIESAIVAGVGLGTLTWAGTSAPPPCKADVCACQKQSVNAGVDTVRPSLP